MRTTCLALAALVAVGCSVTVEKDDRPQFAIDPGQPFLLALGRGSGWHGLETIKIDQSGRVIMHRERWVIVNRVVDREMREVNVQKWEVATIQLAPDSLAAVLGAVEANGLMNLQRAYRDENIHDGTQWVFWVKQGERQKSVYFDNNFPTPITRFAEQLDDILAKAGREKADWQPSDASPRHDRELWDSIRQ